MHKLQGTNLLGRYDGYVILVDEASLLLDLLGIALAFELLAGEPEGNVFVAVLADEELLEELAADGVAH